MTVHKYAYIEITVRHGDERAIFVAEVDPRHVRTDPARTIRDCADSAGQHFLRTCKARP